MDQNILEHILRHMERRNCLKMHFCLTEIFALSVELHQVSCLTVFRKFLYLSAAYFMDTLVIQKSEVGGNSRRAVGSSIFMMRVIILY